MSDNPETYTNTLDCYRSGQMSEAQWQEHLKDEDFADWYKLQSVSVDVSKEQWEFVPTGIGKPSLHIRTGADSWSKAFELNTLTISQNNETVVSIHSNGYIDVNPKYSVTEAAQAFWNAVKEIGSRI